MRLYRVDLDYIKFLHENYDSKVQYNATMSDKYNSNRPYAGVVLEIGDMSYFVPLESPRENHKMTKESDYVLKIEGGRYGLIGLNNMIPIEKEQLITFDINNDKNCYILKAQFIFLSRNCKSICSTALKLYKRRTERPTKFDREVCCDFIKLEQGLRDYKMTLSIRQVAATE
ncbi:MAG: Uncharacterized protein FD169_1783 [Bacillota bacterium]|nr:MAG: Uncharacterized protein FD169_1783 [Bacillota bacterium]